MDVRSRLVPIAIAFALAAVAIVWRLADLQIAQHDFWEVEAVKARTRAVEIPFRRGAILDAQGRPLATTRPTWDLDFDFGTFRKATAAGELLLARFLLTGERGRVARVLADPAPIVAEFAALTIGDMRRLEPGARRADLLAYGAWLTGESGTTELVERLRHAPESEPCLPRLAAEGAAIVARVHDEALLLAALERALALDPGELVTRIDDAIVAIDARVERLLQRRQASEPALKRYEVERGLHKDVDYRATTLVGNVPHRAVFDLAADPSQLPGLVVNERARRVYPKDLDVGAQLVGRVGAPTKEAIEYWSATRDERDELSCEPFPTIEQSRRLHELDELLLVAAVEPEEEIGSEGLEASFEPLLRGRRGFKRTENDRAGAEQKVLEREEPLAGRDLQLTLDADLQRAAEAALARGAPVEKDGPRSVFPSAFVLIELPSMEVRVLASWPAPSRVAMTTQYQELAADDQLRPLHARAWRPWLPPPPGSSLKPILAAFALTSGLIGPTTEFECTRDQLFAPGEKRPVKCEGLHGATDVHLALVKSCNHFFAHLAAKAGSPQMVAWMHSVGLGTRTGFTGARLPDGSEVGALRVEVPGTADSEPGGRNLMLLGMGQGMVDATPLQMAAAIGALALRHWQPPTLIARVGDQLPLRPAPIELPISEAAWRVVVAAMRDVTQEGGTAGPREHVADLSGFDLASKTGTPEQGRTTDPSHSWFVGFFPSRAPRYAFAIFRERTGKHGGDGAAPILRALLDDPAFAEIAASARGARDEAPVKEGGP